MGRAERAKANLTTVASAAGLASSGALAGTRLLPVLPALAELLPERGLRRGSTVTVSPPEGGHGGTSLTLALMAAASASGLWCGVVGMADLGLVAAAEAGLDLSRVAMVPQVAPAQWAAVVGVLVDTVDVVVTRPPPHLRIGDARRLTTRTRERGAVLLALGAWPEGADLRLTVEASRWQGPQAGHGRLEGRRLDVLVGGRGVASRQRRLTLWLPAPEGGVKVDSVAPAAFAGADLESGVADAGLFEELDRPVATAG
jgi:hypothetical protein